MFIPKVIPKATFAVFKVISVQEACAKCFEVHLSKYEILQTTGKKLTSDSSIDLAF